MSNNSNTLHHHLTEVKQGNRCFENAFQGVSRMVLESTIEKVVVNGKTTYDFSIFREGSKHVIGMYDEINSFVSYVKDAAEGGSSKEMAFVLVGEPGNGKTSIARRIYKCFKDSIYIPKTLLISGQLLKFYDPQWHEAIEAEDSVKGLQYDSRWIEIRRPAVVVGGEMDLESLEIKYNSQTKISEAPLQMKANCGTFVVDDLGRQRLTPLDLLNRWILPLEKRIDFMTLSKWN